MKTIFILLTKYSDWRSNLLYYFTGFGYTHASIGLDDEDCYYSFNYRGFAIETMEKHREKGVKKSLRFRIQVSEETYKNLKQRIFEFKDNQSLYQYDRKAVALAFLRIPYQRKNRYFCSQFVAELLVQSKALKLRRNTNVYLPNQLLSELYQCPRLIEAMQDVI